MKRRLKLSLDFLKIKVLGLFEFTKIFSFQKKYSKEYIRKNVKKVVCRFGGKGKRRIEVKNKQIHWFLDWESSNNRDYVRQEMLKKL